MRLTLEMMADIVVDVTNADHKIALFCHFSEEVDINKLEEFAELCGFAIYRNYE